MIFGDKTTAIFDIWSVEHLFTGIILAWLISKISHTPKSNLPVLLLISCFWECLEHYLETGLWGITVQHWFAGVEYWGNRLIGDNLTVFFGYFIYKKYPKTIYFAFGISLIFFCSHLFFPSSMDIQKFLLNLF